MTGESSVFKEGDHSIFYLEEDEEIPIPSGNGYFINNLGASVFVVDEDFNDSEGHEEVFWDEPSIESARRPNGRNFEELKREPRVDFRCVCLEKFRVHVDIVTCRWYCTWFDDVHNHDMLNEVHCAMLPGHRRMSDSEINQMNEMMKVGIGPPHIYRSLAYQAGGYEKIGFKKKGLYNQIHRQRREQSCDAVSALKFLKQMGSKDEMMYFEHTVDSEGRLQHLFWSDGICQLNYQIFGDVLAFDATYGKNKYLLPLVVFSGVNNHNRSTLFAGAIVSNETEETHVWLLNQFVKAMKGKVPSAVITDGDNAMRNAIKRVFPNAHHRLCAWHLLRNATSNVGINGFTALLKKCMMGDYDVSEFEQKWDRLISKFNLEDNQWVSTLYQRRSKWATAHIRGNFFAGFRTTSRCESLHAELAKFVHLSSSGQFGLENLRDPVRVRTKGRGGGNSKSSGLSFARRNKCSICKVRGHNRVTCPQRYREGHGQQFKGASSQPSEDDDIYYPTHELNSELGDED
ncbi:MULE transposase domain [Sesbania bispinosa]|nr:MULE transposase domain [Sesbania bispinosa]